MPSPVPRSLIALAAAAMITEGPTPVPGATVPEARWHGAPARSTQPAPSVEVVLPLDAGGLGPCADQSRHPGRARVDSTGPFDLETDATIPPADLGC
ncbi:hypothetical protein [Benzoatithermus flavus]|uniref:Uncharacterized protein n=1 Tax=Benzoatithermus flavus TaxID=3108223 RepID=A0ABU8XQC0_9PROT